MHANFGSSHRGYRWHVAFSTSTLKAVEQATKLKKKIARVIVLNMNPLNHGLRFPYLELSREEVVLPGFSILMSLEEKINFKKRMGASFHTSKTVFTATHVLAQRPPKVAFLRAHPVPRTLIFASRYCRRRD